MPETFEMIHTRVAKLETEKTWLRAALKAAKNDLKRVAVPEDNFRATIALIDAALREDGHSR